MSAKKVYGIDLGTTYSCIAHVDEHGKPVVLQNIEGEATTPSVVYFESESNIVVGQAAKEVASIHAEQCVSTVKRAMGDAAWQREFAGQPYTPQDISSFILRKLAGDAEQLTGETVEKVVITCPAYFGINEKEATKQAGELAGLEVLYVIPEPTAAALAYGMEQEGEQRVLVYDLGGGTFDVTVIDIRENEITVVCTGGDHELGGKDWDDAIVAYLAERFEEETGTSAEALMDDLEVYQELLNDAEKCKKSLTTREKVTVPVRFAGERATVELTREKFDDLTQHLLTRTLELTDQVVAKAKDKGVEHLDKLLLVGGSTYMPQVTTAVADRLPFEVRQYDPNQAVAKGAAIFGFKCFLDEQIKISIAEQTGQDVTEVDAEEVAEDVREQAEKKVAEDHGLPMMSLKGLVGKKITNVTSKSFGIVAMNSEDREVVFNLIQVDDKVPQSMTQSFGTYEEGQVEVNLRCMENQLHQELLEVSEADEIGKAVLEFGQALPKSSPVEITFDLGPDGLLKLYGKDRTTGKEIHAEFQTNAILSREEVAAARERNSKLQVA